MKRPTLIAVLLGTMILPSSTFAETNPHDPYEKYNRVMFKINDKADRYFLAPVARGYRKYTPKPIRTAASNFVNNLRDVVSFGSNVLRGNAEKAGTDFMRVSLNSTFGLGGLINWADAAGMPNNKNHLGDTFATWGWKNSNYFVYPLLGASTVRDSVGSTITTVASPNKLIIHDTVARYSVAAVGGLEARANLLDASDSIDAAAIDKYAYTRDIYMAYRNKQIGNPVAEVDENIDDLFDENDVKASEKNRQSESKSQKDDFRQPEKDQMLELQDENAQIELKPISEEAQKATDEYIILWQNQSQKNTAFY